MQQKQPLGTRSPLPTCLLPGEMLNLNHSANSRGPSSSRGVIMMLIQTRWEVINTQIRREVCVCVWRGEISISLPNWLDYLGLPLETPPETEQGRELTGSGALIQG